MTDLAIIETLDAVSLFEKKTAVLLVDDLCREYRANVYDISDESGRKAVAKDAALINKWSNGLDGLGKDHVAVLKSKPKLIDAERKKMRDTLSELRTEILQPLTDWENAEKLRVANIQERINNMRVSVCGVKSPRVDTLEGSKEFMLELTNTVIDNSFEELKESAEHQKEEAMLILSGIIARFLEEKATADANAKLQAEADAKARLEHEERIRLEATKAAELKAENEKKEIEFKAAKEKQDILNREQKAINDAAQAERDKIAAQERAKIEQEQAVQAEKDRAAKIEQDKIDAEAARARNTQHKGRINRDARDALMELSFPGSFTINQTQAELIVALIAKGKIPNITIKY